MATQWRSIYVGLFAMFIGGIQMGAIMTTIWPYLKVMDPALTEDTYGLIHGLSALGGVLTSAITGWLINKIGNTKPGMLAGNILAAVVSGFYLSIERAPWMTVFLFAVYDFGRSAAQGMLISFRTYVASATADADKARAFGLMSTCMSVSMLLGPLMQMGFNQFTYPGFEILSIHVNYYTAPIIFGAIMMVIAAVLILKFFDGRITPHHDVTMPTSDIDGVDIELMPREMPDGTKKAVLYDKVAVVVLFVAKFGIDLAAMMLFSIFIPYEMTTFEWTSADTVKYTTMLMAGQAVMGFLVSASYSVFKIVRWIPERVGVLISFSLMLAAYILTFPWGFIQETIPYEHPVGSESIYSQSEAAELLNSTLLESPTNLVGCSVQRAWCETTPRVNVYVFNMVLPGLLGMAMPMMHINMDVLLAKVIGPAPQGLLQAAFVAVTDVLRVIVPVTATKVYVEFGPRPLWMFVIVEMTLLLGFMLVFFARLVPYAQRINGLASERSSSEKTSANNDNEVDAGEKVPLK